MNDQPVHRKSIFALTDEEVNNLFPDVDLFDFRDAAALYEPFEEAWQQEHMALVPNIAEAEATDPEGTWRGYYQGFLGYMQRITGVLARQIKWTAEQAGYGEVTI